MAIFTKQDSLFVAAYCVCVRVCIWYMKFYYIKKEKIINFLIKSYNDDDSYEYI